MSLCFELLAAGLIGYYLGQYLDKLWDTGPWWALGLLILFFSLALTHALRVLFRLQEQLSEKGGENQ